MVEVSLDRNQLNKLLKNFDNFKSTLNFQKPITKGLQILRDEERQNFEQQGRIYGYWKPLREATRVQRERLGYRGARPILVRTGTLKNGFRVRDVKKDSGKIENSVSYAKYHQEGTNKMPQRKIIGSTNKSKRAIGLVFSNFIAGNLLRYFKIGR